MYVSGENLIFVTTFCVCDIGKEIPQGGKMGPGQGGSQSEWGWEEGNIRGGNWAQAREGPRTISPKWEVPFIAVYSLLSC